MQTLSEIDLAKQAPSIFAMQAHEKTSSSYALIPTIECVRGLKKAGFHPVQAMESRSRNVENRPYAKHTIRFRHEGVIEVGGNVPEIVLVNSHNGLSSYQLRAGIYRLVCSNGLVVGNDLFYRSVRHQGDVISKVVESASEIIDIIPRALEVAEEWKGITLDVEAQRVYAQSAGLLKGYDEESPVESDKLLRPRRYQDTGNDLWTTFNIVQENIIRGGIRYYNPDNLRRGRTRGVNSVSENNRLNTALWNLTEKMAVLAK